MKLEEKLRLKGYLKRGDLAKLSKMTGMSVDSVTNFFKDDRNNQLCGALETLANQRKKEIEAKINNSTDD